MEHQPQKSSCSVSGGNFDRKKEIEKVERRVKVRSSERLCIIKNNSPLSSVPKLGSETYSCVVRKDKYEIDDTCRGKMTCALEQKVIRI